MNESVEVAAAFDAAGKMVVRPREGGVNHVSFGPSEPLNDVVVIHNHPQGGSPSTDDFIFAVERNLKGFKVVLPTGVVYSCDRPTAGWPSSDNMEYELEKIYDALVQFRSERYTLSRRNVSESEVQEFLSAQRVSCLKSIGVELKKGDVFTW